MPTNVATPIIDWPKFAKDVRSERAIRQWDMRKVAEFIHSPTASTIWRAEHGHPLTADSFLALCMWLGRTAESYSLAWTQRDMGNEVRT